ncbi:MAG: hypothetical protein ACK415_00470 [Thermodesulfovibrionales bacterium]
MKVQSSKFKVQSSKFKIQTLGLIFFCSIVLLGLQFHPFTHSSIHLFTYSPTLAFAAEKWPGVDESVVEKYAKEHGREAREPLINTDQGDLLLFVFLMAGTVGGFVAGYYWKTLMEDRIKSQEQRAKTKERKDYT